MDCRENFPMREITLDPALQLRVVCNPEIIDDYAEAMANGEAFPAIALFRDGDVYRLADGWHRYHAARKIGLDWIAADVHDGDARAALLYAIEANARHGLHLSRDDKRRAAETMLNDPEWAAWSDRQIGRRCGVSHEFVGATRERIASVNVDSGVTGPDGDADLSMLTDGRDPRTRTVTRNGVTYRMNVGNIGKRPAPGPGPRGREVMRPWSAPPKVNAHGLLPCPFCGETDINIFQQDPESDHCAICRSAECNIIGPRSRDPEKARSGWNRRT